MTHSAKTLKPVANTEWTPIQYQEKGNSSDWLKEKLKTKPTKKRKIFKPGPRDIGRIECKNGWTPIKLTKTEEISLNCGAFLQEQSTYKTKKSKKRKKKLKIYKPGPRDIGKNDKWKQTPIKRRKSAPKYIKLKRIKLKSSVSAQVSNLKIIFSPNTSPTINEVTFIGFPPSPQPTYSFRGKSKSGADETPQPQSARFTFEDITSKYKPHRIKWTKAKSCNDARIATEFTFSDEEESESQEFQEFDGNDNDCKHNEKCRQINELLSALFECEADESNEDLSGDDNDNISDIQTMETMETKTVKTATPNYTIVIDGIEKNEKGDNVYSGCIESSFKNIENDDDDGDDGELLFDFSSFISNLKKKMKDNNHLANQMQMEIAAKHK